MIEIIPFKAYLPEANKADSTSTRPIYSYSNKEILEIKRDYPHSFLNIILHDEEKKELSLDDRFKKIKELFEESVGKEKFIQSKEDSFYIYRQTSSNSNFTGIIAGAATKDYREEKIKKHEQTLEKREKLFTKYLELTGFNAEPILLIHESNKELKQIISELTEKTPIHSFTSSDGLTHELWEVQDESSKKNISSFYKTMDCLYIADGHHRSASSNLLSQQQQSKKSTQYVMALLMDENDITIYDFNRVIKNDNNLSKSEILKSLEKKFEVGNESDQVISPQQKHEFCLYIDNKWIRLILKKDYLSNSNIIKKLDSQIITDLILSPIFGIEDLKNDKRVDFIPGNEGLGLLQQEVDNGKFDLAIAMFPVSAEELKLVADNKLTMPPKSTYIEPKLRSGLTVYKF